MLFGQTCQFQILGLVWYWIASSENIHCTNEPQHDNTNKMSVRPAKTQISLGIHSVWSESSLSTWRKLGSLATHLAHSEDSDQTGRMPRLIWVFAGHTLILLVLSCRRSNECCVIRGPKHVFFGLAQYVFLCLEIKINEPCHEKTCFRGLWPGKTQTGLRSHRS